MSPVLDTTPPACPETAARNRRVAALTSALSDSNSELCAAFDEAVEFAACEGNPVSAAIAEFLQEDWGPALQCLKKLVVPDARFIPAKLPVLPRASARVLRTSDERSSVGELEAIAGSDPALTARLLSAANSALYGSRSEIFTLREAVLRIGIPAARKVLLATSFGSLFVTNAMRELWEHSQHVADAAFQLAGLCGADPASAYAAGLLHDFGRLAFTVFPANMQAAERRWLDAGFPLIYAETMAYGTDHAAFGAELLRSWNLPAEIVETVAHHHRPECSDSRLHAVVHLAEAPDEDLWSNMRKQTALDRAGIARERMEAVLA